MAGVANEVRYTVHNPSIRNLERAVLERVFFVKGASGAYTAPPQPHEGHIKRKLSGFKKLLVKVTSRSAVMSRAEFVAWYHGRRRAIYQNAATSLEERKLTIADSYIRCFGKAEKTNLSAKKDPVMRVVSPRDPRYNICVGVFLKPLEHNIYSGINKVFGELTIFKGLNAREAGIGMHNKWCKYHRPVAISIDATRFDQHVSVDALKWEHGVYLELHNHNPELAKLLRWQLTNHCRGYCKDGKLKYIVKGTRMSGDMNTAVGNCLIMCAMMFSFLSDLGLTQQVSLANNGDDCILIMDQKHFPTVESSIKNWFLKMGFNMVTEKPVFNLESIDFCQTHPVYDGKDYIMVRDPRITVSKDAISIKPLSDRKTYCRWIKAIGECGMALTGGIPVVQEYYQALIRTAGDVKPIVGDTLLETGMFQLARGMHREYMKPTIAARVSFYFAFGVSLELQVILEKYYAKASPAWKGLYITDYPDCDVTWLR